jgi:hypothetical protein
MVAECLSTCERWLYLPETQEKTRYKLNNPMDKQVRLAVPIFNSQHKYISASKQLTTADLTTQSIKDWCRDEA